MGDLLNSIGVIVAVVLIYFTGWRIIDPIISIVISSSFYVVVIKLRVMRS